MKNNCVCFDSDESKMCQSGSETLPAETSAENPSVPAAAHRYKHSRTHSLHVSLCSSNSCTLEVKGLLNYGALLLAARELKLRSFCLVSLGFYTDTQWPNTATETCGIPLFANQISVIQNHVKHLCSFADYLKNLPEDSEDYKDTQGQTKDNYTEENNNIGIENK